MECGRNLRILIGDGAAEICRQEEKNAEWRSLFHTYLQSAELADRMSRIGISLV
jgi:hypothetical protein